MAWSLGHVTSMCKTGTQWVWSLGHVTSTCNHGHSCWIMHTNCHKLEVTILMLKLLENPRYHAIWVHQSPWDESKTWRPILSVSLPHLECSSTWIAIECVDFGIKAFFVDFMSSTAQVVAKSTCDVATWVGSVTEKNLGEGVLFVVLLWQLGKGEAIQSVSSKTSYLLP